MVSNMRIYRLTIAALAAATLEGQIRGPMLGYVWDARQESLRPVLGIAGSSTLGRAVAVNFAVKQASISPNQDFAMVLGGDGRVAHVVDLRGVEPASRVLESLPGNAERVILSPRGTAAVVIYSDPKRLYVLTGLPQNPVVARQVELSAEGVPALCAVSDDGGAVLAAYPETRTLITIDENGNFLRLGEEVEVRSAAFLEGSREALTATNRGVLRIGGNSVMGVLFESAAVKAVSSSSDGKRVLIADGESSSVIEVVLDTGERRQVDCPCVPSAVSRISQGVFRLNEVSSSPLWLVEVQESGMRTIFVPPDPVD